MIRDKQKPIEVIVDSKLRLLHELIRLTAKTAEECQLLGADTAIRNSITIGDMTYQEADVLLDKMLLEFNEFKEAFIEQMFETCDELFKWQDRTK